MLVTCTWPAPSCAAMLPQKFSAATTCSVPVWGAPPAEPQPAAKSATQTAHAQHATRCLPATGGAYTKTIVILITSESSLRSGHVGDPRKWLGGGGAGVASAAGRSRRRCPYRGDRAARQAGVLPRRAGDLRPAALGETFRRAGERLSRSRPVELGGVRAADRAG